MTLPGTDVEQDAAEAQLGERAIRTRDSIVDAARTLFLTKGYAGTRIADITDACNISRAGFYTYFKDKLEVFYLLGRTAYRENLAIFSAWEEMSRPCTRADVDSWVLRYFAFLDLHGAFVLSANTTPDSDEVRADSTRMTVRCCFLLGVGLRARQNVPTETPEALGMAFKSLLDRTWHQLRVEPLPMEDDEVRGAVIDILLATLDN
ncbi:hypothetical protein GCM10009836_24410 [Pseudonocardia ailaonensis]|uniref:HTH tetR-type domain-containing protein n=1 Tax=Pseudonocardia ailaonensis TaxID=367279 RepID=A0ABN2MZR7_9PSEU